ncbi:MAG: LysR substrate-binding domain-containing protein [Steroidobacteraceae bacterium]
MGTELSSTDRYVDVVSEGFDCVVRSGTLGDSRRVARRLGAYWVVNCASSGYLAQHCVPHSLEDLARHQLIHYVSKLGARGPSFEYPHGKEDRSLPIPGVLTVNSVDAYEHACLADLGIIPAPAPGVREYAHSGALVDIRPQYRPEPIPLSVV